MANLILSGLVDIAALITLLILVYNTHSVLNGSQKYFSLAIISVIIIILSDLAKLTLCEYTNKSRFLLILCNIFGFCFSPLVPVFIKSAISPKMTTFEKILCIPPIINIIMCLLSFKFYLIFKVTSNYTYTSGSCFFVYVIAYVSALILLYTTNITIQRNYQESIRASLAVVYLFIILGAILQYFFPDIHILWTCNTIAIIIYYAFYCKINQKIDGVTGLLDRCSYEIFKSNLKKSDKAIILFIDIDNFKTVNDTYGHQFGDYCLNLISSELKNAFNGIAFCFRYGGDELCVISINADNETFENAKTQFCRKIKDLCSKCDCFPDVSVGQAVYDKSQNTLDEAVTQADNNMYTYKSKNKVIK